MTYQSAAVRKNWGMLRQVYQVIEKDMEYVVMKWVDRLAGRMQDWRVWFGANHEYTCGAGPQEYRYEPPEWYWIPRWENEDWYWRLCEQEGGDQ
jgi:hypothetical protein